jgi:ribose transport system permease protein
LAQLDAAPVSEAVSRRTLRRLAPNPALILLVIGCTILEILQPKFLSVYNVINIAEQASALGVMTIGLAIVLLIGGIDLSIPAIMACS